jgi:hypothetical protein
VAVEYGLPALHSIDAETLAEQPQEHQAEWCNRAVRNFKFCPAEDPEQFIRSIVVSNNLGPLVDFDPEEL